MTHKISADHLSIERIGEIITKGIKLELSDDARQRIIRCREYLDKKIETSDKPVYEMCIRDSIEAIGNDSGAYCTLVAIPIVIT